MEVLRWGIIFYKSTKPQRTKFDKTHSEYHLLQHRPFASKFMNIQLSIANCGTCSFHFGEFSIKHEIIRNKGFVSTNSFNFRWCAKFIRLIYLSAYFLFNWLLTKLVFNEKVSVYTKINEIIWVINLYFFKNKFCTFSCFFFLCGVYERFAYRFQIFLSLRSYLI